MKELVNIHVGQAGVQTAQAMWELFCAEHGIDCRGMYTDSHDDNTFESFFELTPKRQYVPRAVLIDLEPSVIDEIRLGPYRSLFHPDRLISSNEDAANNYARGRHTCGRYVMDHSLNQIRKVIEGCDSIQGIMLTNSIGGGTGSGHGSLLLEKLTENYGKKAKIQVCVFPSTRLSTSIVEPYNSVLSCHSTADHSDISLIYDNESLFRLVKSKLNIQSPAFHHINRLTALVLSSLTVSMRFEGDLHSDINQMQTNLVPYPRIHFPILSHAPVMSEERANHTTLNELSITQSAFSANNQMMSCVNPKQGRYMACVLLYRGNVCVGNVNKAILNIKKDQSLQWVDWCPTGFKFGVNNAKPVAVPSSGIARTEMSTTMISNNTSIVNPFRQLSNKFTLLFSKRAFVHHYVGEGMEEGELNEASENIQAIIQDYMEVAVPSNELDGAQSPQLSSRGSTGRGDMTSPEEDANPYSTDPNEEEEEEEEEVEEEVEEGEEEEGEDATAEEADAYEMEMGETEENVEALDAFDALESHEMN